MRCRLTQHAVLLVIGLLTTLIVAIIGFATLRSIQTPPADLSQYVGEIERNIYVDRFGKRLNMTYENEWNLYDRVSIHDVPPTLRHAFLLSEDKRFFSHSGVDWLARMQAFRQNLFAGEIVRGASTISEQVVRMINPRPRNIWSRMLEGFEAAALEREHGKLEILEFYLNQVPYGSRRRGIVQAARFYFDRDVDTLNEKEMLTLAVLVRSPKWLDPETRHRQLERAIIGLARRMENQRTLPVSLANFFTQNIIVRHTRENYNVQHFLDFAGRQSGGDEQGGNAVHTTLDLELQDKVQQILDGRLQRLRHRRVSNGAVLIVDHESNEILSWVVGYAGQKDKAFNQLDAVRTRRQPGSALKPLLYANAFLHGWTAATLVDDSPLQESVGIGMHTYENYSREHYGNITVREALGNSLNIPAVRTIQFVGPQTFLSFLHGLGIDSLSLHPNVYGDGLALGNGELTLFELVEAYTVLARMGDHKGLTALESAHRQNDSRRVFSDDVASLVADILSDPTAREKEFGRNSILNFPHQTAIKTGTSSDYRDAWAMGFNDKYTVGVWMGNMDYSPMDEVTGSTGPALVLRSIFNELNRHRDARGLYLSDKLVKRRICVGTGLTATDKCEARDEWFISGTTPATKRPPPRQVRLRKPSRGLSLAMDPRISDEYEYFEFSLSELDHIERVRWFVNENLIATTKTPVYHWKLSRGEFSAYAEVFLGDDTSPIKTDVVTYRVN